MAIVLAFLGFLFSTKSWIMFLLPMNPIEVLVIYYIILYVALLTLSKFDLIIYDIKIDNPIKVFGLLLITFAFFIVVNWTNAYVQYVSTGTFEGAASVFYGSEDGATWYFFYNVLGITNLLLARFLTFVFAPFLLVLLGSFCVTEIEM